MFGLHLKTLFQPKWYYVSMILWKAFIDLAIVHLCSELLFCKKGVGESTHAEDLSLCPEEKQQLRLWKSPLGTTFRGSKRTSSQEGREGSRPAVPSPQQRLEPREQAEGLGGGRARVTPVQCVPLGTIPRLRSSRVSPQAALWSCWLHLSSPMGLLCSPGLEKQNTAMLASRSSSQWREFTDFLLVWRRQGEKKSEFNTYVRGGLHLAAGVHSCWHFKLITGWWSLNYTVNIIVLHIHIMPVWFHHNNILAISVRFWRY